MNSEAGQSRSDVPVASSPPANGAESGEAAASTFAPGAPTSPAPALATRSSDVPVASSPSTNKIGSGGDSASTFILGVFKPSEGVGHVRGGNLPHWRQGGVTYFVTWRTADSIPAQRVREWLREREVWLARNPPPRSQMQIDEYSHNFTATWERWLDECHGECLLRRPDLRRVVEDAIRYFDGQRYALGESVVMPNHVHVLVTPLPGHALSQILQRWKSFTSHRINRILGRSGAFWQKETFDHIIRSADQLERVTRYIRDNPRRSNVHVS